MPQPRPSPRSRAWRCAALAVLLLPSISACDHQVSKPQLLQRDPPSPELTECPPEPARAPETFTDETARLQWASEAIQTGRACRETLARLKDWALHPPGAP